MSNTEGDDAEEANRGGMGLPAFITKGVKRKKLKKSTVPPPKHARDYTQLEHRLKHDEHEVGGQNKGGVKSHRILHPLRIDRLFHANVITEEQHEYGVQITALWMVAGKPFLGSMNYGEVRRGYAIEEGKLGKMTAEDRFYRTMLYLASPHIEHLQQLRKTLGKPMSRKERAQMKRHLTEVERLNAVVHKRSHDLICLICFDELGAIEAAGSVGVGINNAVETVQQAFDSLGEALKKMRAHRKKLEEPIEPEQVET